MIISKISGGLGNQMFQYAAGHSVASKLKTEHCLDIRAYETDRVRSFGLDRLNISASIAPQEILPPAKHQSLLRYAIWKSLRLKPKLLKEHKFNFDAIERNFKGASYLSGHWFSEEYFQNFAAELREEFRLTGEFSDYGSNILRAIKKSTAISIHIRRGDYVDSDYWRSKLGTCSIGYYHKGLEYIRSKIDVEFGIFVFSDDIDWASDNFKTGEKTTFVSNSESTGPHEDLMLMASCKHHIIANSTFSWWGAWLDARFDKIVICPYPFYDDKSARCITPASWKALPRSA